MFKHRALLLTLSVFLLWWILGLGSNLLTHQIIDPLSTSNTDLTAGSIVYAISLGELALRLVGTYFIARYFLNQPAHHFERE